MGKFHEDLVDALSAISNPELDGQANYGSYTTLPTCLNVARSILSQHNLALIQVVLPDPARLVTRIIHSSGDCIEDGGVELIYDKSNVQKLGSAITYARRYGLCSLLGIAGQQDDDGIIATAFKDLPKKQQTVEQKQAHEKVDKLSVEPTPSNKVDDDLLDPESIKEVWGEFLSNIGASTEESVNDMGIDDVKQTKLDLVKFWKDNSAQREDLSNSDKQSSEETLSWITERVKQAQTFLKNRENAIKESEK